MRLIVLISILLGVFQLCAYPFNPFAIKFTKTDSISLSNLALAKYYEKAEMQDSAMFYAQRAFDQYDGHQDLLDSQVVAGLLLASMLNKKAENEKALSLILTLIPKAAKTGNDSLHATSYGHAGIIYNHLFMNKDARVMFQKSYELFIQSDTLKAYQQLSNLSLLKARDPSSVEEALRDQRKIYAYQLKKNIANDQAISMINFGVIFTHLGDTDSAIHYLKKVIAMEEKIKLTALENANYYLSMVYIDRNEPSKALPFAIRSYELSIASNIAVKAAYSSQLLSRIHEMGGNYREALNYQNHADSILNYSFHETYSRRITELKVQFEAEQKQREIDQLHYESELAEKERIIYLFLFLLLVVMFVLLSTYFRKEYRKQKLEIRSQRIEKAEVQKELECKKSEFASHSLSLIQKDELLKDIKESIEAVRRKNLINPDANEELRLLISKLDFNLNIEKNWEDFKIHFEQIHGDFAMTLSRRYPQLSNNELRLCSLIKIGLSVKEMATLLNISAQGVKTARYRLRKKFELKKEEKLLSFLHALEGELLETF